MLGKKELAVHKKRDPFIEDFLNGLISVFFRYE